jgi:uncharacterized protein YggU (UPF0235/DUF167 family)
MKIFVDAKPNAKITKCEELKNAHFKISVKEPAKEGKANHAIAKILAKQLGVAPSRLTLLSGATGKRKVFEVV